MKRTLVLSTLLAMALLLTFGLLVAGCGSTPSAGGEVRPYAVGSNDGASIIWHVAYGGSKFFATKNLG
jgi:ABC-type oligopeptide transport system substrate-binding subunit